MSWTRLSTGVGAWVNGASSQFLFCHLMMLHVLCSGSRGKQALGDNPGKVVLDDSLPARKDSEGSDLGGFAHHDLLETFYTKPVQGITITSIPQETPHGVIDIFWDFRIFPRIIERLNLFPHAFLTNYQSGYPTIYMSLTALSGEIRNLALSNKWMMATGS